MAYHLLIGSLHPLLADAATTPLSPPVQGAPASTHPVMVGVFVAIGIATVLYFVMQLLSRGESRPAHVLSGLLRGSRTVILAAVVLALVLGTLRALSLTMWGGASVAQLAFDMVASAIAVVAGLFLIRQFLAPPWWRLNAWNPAVDDLGARGSTRSTLAWILGDAKLGFTGLRRRDRIVLCIGVPVIAADIAHFTSMETMLSGVFTALLVLYVALVVALMTANRIPRVLMSRLVELRQVANRIAHGDLRARASTSELGDYEELGELVTDINTMAAALQSRDQQYRALQDQLTGMLHTEKEIATRDALTGLRNRRFFEQALHAELDRSARTGATCSIASLDLDNFKQVNDRFGHPEGDAVLQRMAHALLAALRPYDLACRLGGEEFGVIFPQTRPEEAQVVLDRIMMSLSQAGPQGAPQTFSAGIAAFPEHARDEETLFRLADEAAYDAKLKGKARTLLYHPAHTKQMHSPERQAEKRRADMIATAKALVATVDAKESMSRNHSETVGTYAKRIALALGQDAESADKLYLCGILHDVGKIGLSETIMNKPGRLTPDEYEQVRQHPELGAQIVSNAGLKDIALWVRHHHEHYDGTGYPSQLRGEDIPLGARIVQVAEAFDVMTTDRVYRRGMTAESALQQLAQGAGTTFDPHVVQAMTWLVQTGQIEVGGAAAVWAPERAGGPDGAPGQAA